MNTSVAVTIAERRAKKFEGFEGMVYKDTQGVLTIGYGHNLEANPISERVGELLLKEDMDEAVRYLHTYKWFKGLTACRKAALMDMMFNLGPKSFAGFHQMIAALEDGDFKGAAHEMMASLWHEQNTHRCEADAKMLEEDSYEADRDAQQVLF